MICSNCGRENDANAKFCSFCGHIFMEHEMSDPAADAQTPEQPSETGQTAWQPDKPESAAGNPAGTGQASGQTPGQLQGAEGVPDPHKLRPEPGYKTDDVYPRRTEDTLSEANRKYRKRILICAIVAFAALAALVGFFLLRPDQEKKPSDTEQTTLETVQETTAEPQTTTAEEQPQTVTTAEEVQAATAEEQLPTTTVTEELQTTTSVQQETTAVTQQPETTAEAVETLPEALTEGEEKEA